LNVREEKRASRLQMRQPMKKREDFLTQRFRRKWKENGIRRKGIFGVDEENDLNQKESKNLYLRSWGRKGGETRSISRVEGDEKMGRGRPLTNNRKRETTWPRCRRENSQKRAKKHREETNRGNISSQILGIIIIPKKREGSVKLIR